MRTFILKLDKEYNVTVGGSPQGGYVWWASWDKNSRELEMRYTGRPFETKVLAASDACYTVLCTAKLIELGVGTHSVHNSL